QTCALRISFSIFGSFYPNVRFFFNGKILVGDIEGGAKKTLSSKKKTQFCFFYFFCWAQFFGPTSEWRPVRPPIPPVGKTAPEHTHTCGTVLLRDLCLR